MPMIHILRAPNAEGVRVEDDVDEALLVKTWGVLDNDHEHTTWVEYRFPASDLIVHRSVHVMLKAWTETPRARAWTAARAWQLIRGCFQGATT